MEDDIIYIHYGATAFKPEKFHPVRNGGFLGKPAGNTGLWASRINDSDGWKQWNEENDFTDCREENSFCFHISKDANVVVLSHPRQLESLPLIAPYTFSEDNSVFHDEQALLDYEAMVQNGVDAIELIWHPLFRDALWGWDCSCIFIMNPDIVEPM